MPVAVPSSPLQAAQPIVWLDVETRGERPDALRLFHVHAHKVLPQGADAHLDLAIVARRKRAAANAMTLQEAAPVLNRFLHQCDLLGRNGGVALTQNMAREGYELPMAAVNVAEVLEEIMEHQATFTARDLAARLRGRLPEARHVELCQQELLDSCAVLALGKDDDGATRFTTPDMLRCEQRLLELTTCLAARQGHRAANLQGPSQASLTAEQRAALVHVTQRTGDLAVVAGYAGAGKSTMLRAAREVWEAAGYRVRGVALAGKAAEELDKLSGIPSRTVASWEWAQKRGQDGLRAGDVLVLDEASMVGTRMMGRLLEAAAQAGAKLVLVGDVEQLPAIEAGAPLRAMAAQAGEARLHCICRQATPWMRQATLQLAQNETAAALQAYDQAGHLHAHATHAEALQAVAQAWDAASQAHPEQSQLMLAYRRADVKALNEAARSSLQARGQLREQTLLATDRGPRAFAAGDRLYFLRNDRRLGVRNGSLGTVAAVRGHGLVVRLDGSDKQVAVDVRRYPHIDHGYAATVHKAQGATVDSCYVLASELFDRNVTYVALSRHRQTMDLNWGQDKFDDAQALASSLGRSRRKELALDYMTPHSAAALRLQRQRESAS